MSEIQYRVAKNVKDAVALMAKSKGKGYVLAGGTDLLVQMKSGTRSPGVIVDVKKIPEMVTVVPARMMMSPPGECVVPRPAEGVVAQAGREVVWRPVMFGVRESGCRRRNW